MNAHSIPIYYKKNFCPTMIGDLVKEYLRPLEQRHPGQILEVLFAGELLISDAEGICELEVPAIDVVIPLGLLAEYRARRGVREGAQPNPYAFWDALRPCLIGKGVQAPNQYSTRQGIDGILLELERWPIEAHLNEAPDKAILHVRAQCEDW